MSTDHFQREVEAKIAALRHRRHGEVEAELAQKRAAWARQRLVALRQERGRALEPTPRAAFELFIRDYLGADLQTVPVIHESPHEIAWLAQNRCDTLEACRALGLEPRVVCRARYDKPVQFLLSQLDPQLRFVRNYDHLRPKAEACEERIVRVDFGEWMDLALEEAHRSWGEVSGRYGAIVARGRDVIARAHDTVSESGDPSAHAEHNALRRAVEQLGDLDLCGCVLVSTCEPCPMCASLAVWANVTSMVYGVSIDETAELGHTRIAIRARDVVARSPATVEVLGGWRHDRCLELYRR